jgi:regulatory Fis family protein
MAAIPISAAEIKEMVEALDAHHGDRTKAAASLGMNRSTFYSRLHMLREKGVNIVEPGNAPRVMFNNDGKIDLILHDGVALVGSDAHYWPGDASTAHRAFVKFCKKLKPKIVIKNGDVLDGATISRHSPIGWESRPSLINEMEACKDRLGEITKASLGAQRIWPLGNHDARFETRLASVAPEYAKIHGVHLKDHFPDWQSCWLCVINGDVVIKHRFKSGIHAPHNNTLWSGKTIITGHLHSLKVMPISDYNGTRFGVDCGTMANPYGPQFSDYTELSPVSWRSGFIVLTFRDGRLMWPEIVHVINEEQVEFRGEIISV